MGPVLITEGDAEKTQSDKDQANQEEKISGEDSFWFRF